MATSSPSPGSVVLAWNNIYLDVVRRIGGAPGPLARIGGLMHLAMYEAVNRLAPGNYPTLIDDNLLSLPVTGTPDPATSAAYAACYTLTAAVEAYLTIANTIQMQGGVLNPFGPFQVHPAADPHALGLTVTVGVNALVDNTASEAYGKAIADGVLKAYPANTGLDTDVDPLPDPLPGEWRETGSGPALTPQWGKVPLFLLASQPTTSYLPTTIPSNLLDYSALLATTMYAEQVAEVKLLGGAHAPARTPEQTEIAFFWANDLNGTSKPPGQLYTISQDVAKQQGTPQNLLETARLFALVGTAMVNASIVAWQAKYYNPATGKPLRLWRPETAIRLANTDGNPSTAADPAWQPLSAMASGTRFSPNFPAYVSGHSTFGAAWAVAMKKFYVDRDDISFAATTEDPHAIRDENGVRRTRHFTSFTQAALENGRSRVYLGVHYQFDANGGYEIGTKVGEDTAAYFQKQTAPIGGLTLLSARADITALEDSNLVFLRNTNEPVWLDLTVSTYCQWTFTLDPGVDENQPPDGNANRQLHYALPAALLAQRVASWTLIITNQTKETQEYEGRVRLVQGTSIATGVEVYNHPIAPQQLPPTTENPASPPDAISRTLTFYAVAAA